MNSNDVFVRYRASKVARRFITASLADQIEERIKDFLKDPGNIQANKQFASWLSDNFAFEGSKTPKGGKAWKEVFQRMHWELTYGLTQHRPEIVQEFVQRDWDILKANLPEVVKLFTSEGGRNIPKEVQVGANTYRNLSGFTDKQLDGYIKVLEKVFDELKGWRKKALSGGLKIALAGPKEFHGTAAGKYKSSEDTLYVRATPQILKRAPGSYGSFDYIIVHELGHRYEYKNSTQTNFDVVAWKSSKYSQNDGEAFAELFAISNFDLKGPWREEVIKKFNDLMG
jgi:hypothetical protein